MPKDPEKIDPIQADADARFIAGGGAFSREAALVAAKEQAAQDALTKAEAEPKPEPKPKPKA